MDIRHCKKSVINKVAEMKTIMLKELNEQQKDMDDTLLLKNLKDIIEAGKEKTINGLCFGLTKKNMGKE